MLETVFGWPNAPAAHSVDVDGIPHQYAIDELGVNERVPLSIGFGVDLKAVVISVRRAGWVAQKCSHLILMHPFLQSLDRAGSTGVCDRLDRLRRRGGALCCARWRRGCGCARHLRRETHILR